MQGIIALALLVAGADKMYLTVDKNGIPVVTDYPHGGAVRYEPGDFDKFVMRQKGVPHRGLSVEDAGFGGPPIVIELHESSSKRAGAAPGAATRTAPAHIEELLRAASAKTGVSLSLLRAVVAVESAFRPNAVSHAGAMGLMQLMPGTATDLGVKDAFDPAQNVDGGARYLASLLRHFKTEALALAAYNAGPGRVAREGRVPDIPETQAYVQSVLGLRRAYDGH